MVRRSFVMGGSKTSAQPTGRRDGFAKRMTTHPERARPDSWPHNCSGILAVVTIEDSNRLYARWTMMQSYCTKQPIWSRCLILLKLAVFSVIGWKGMM